MRAGLLRVDTGRVCALPGCGKIVLATAQRFKDKTQPPQRYCSRRCSGRAQRKCDHDALRRRWESNRREMKRTALEMGVSTTTVRKICGVNGRARGPREQRVWRDGRTSSPMSVIYAKWRWRKQRTIDQVREAAGRELFLQPGMSILTLSAIADGLYLTDAERPRFFAEMARAAVAAAKTNSEGEETHATIATAG